MNARMRTFAGMTILFCGRPFAGASKIFGQCFFKVPLRALNYVD
jgi:hypothetical protein